MKDAIAIFRFLRDCEAQGEPAALVTLTGVLGSTARAVGTHMAVSQSGAAVGSFSGGCVEAAVVAEAQESISAGLTRSVRFGAGSPYIDVRLPCGGGIDLLFVPNPSPAVVRDACDLLDRRIPLILGIDAEGRMDVRADHADRTGWQDELFVVRHDPALRLVVIGHGTEPVSLIRLALAYGADTLLLSPDDMCIAAAGQLGSRVGLLRFTGRSDLLCTDSHTAVVCLFHDHDWEPELLAQALEQEAFFVGAMGSRRTHADRCTRLSNMGVPIDSLARLTGPIGLIEAARDPDTLAVSVLAQIVGVRQTATNRVGADGGGTPSSDRDEQISSSH